MSYTDDLENLKNAICALKPTGQNGFEGFVAAILGKISGHTFRLAGSGSQYGKDGDASSQTSHISFECKLYTKPLVKNEILSKSVEILSGTDIPDAWILGATQELKTQIHDPLKSNFEMGGVSLIILDWPENMRFPPLACACAIAEDVAIEFFQKNITNKKLFTEAKSAISSIRSISEFSSKAGELERSLREPTLGLQLAIEKNSKWLKRIFSDKRHAKQILGQPISPIATSKIALQPRRKLVATLTEKVFLKVNDSVNIIFGDEGCGKSWLFAQTWCQLENSSLTIIVPASEIGHSFSYEQLEKFLIDKIITQTGDSLTDVIVARWCRRFKQWKNISIQNEPPRLVVFIDGLNQNAKIVWSRIIDSFGRVLSDLGGNLVLSSRKGYYNSNIKDTLLTDLNPILVQEWSLDELKEILLECAIDIKSITEAVIKTLRNPRILSIAIELLDSAQIVNFSELNVERLLFEHIRASAKEGSALERPEQFKDRLSKHAQEIISRVKRDQEEDQLIFEIGGSGSSLYNLSADLLAVTEGHFFHPLENDPNLYTLSQEGLSVAFGIALIKSLQKSERNDLNLAETLNEIIEPISALDMTSKAMISALLISSIDDNCSEAIGETILLSFIKQQNIDFQEYSIFSSAVRARPSSALNTLYRLACQSEYIANKDWLLSALSELKYDTGSWNMALSCFDKWLRVYSLSPELSVHAFYAKGDKENYDKMVSERRDVLSQRMDSLSSAEKGFISLKMTQDDEVNTSELSSDIFKIISGSSISSFSEALVAWAFSQSLNCCTSTDYNDFESLIRFNSQDWRDTRDKLLNIAKIFDGENSSNTGKWSMIAILRATGTQEDADKASLIFEELTKDREKYEGWRLVEKYCASDPCDPSSTFPDNIKSTAVNLKKIMMEDMRESRWMTKDDIFLRDTLPGLVRFLPGETIKYYRNRTNHSVGQGIQSLRNNLTEFTQNFPIFTSEIVESLIKIAAKTHVPEPWNSAESKDTWVIVQYSLFAVFSQINGDRQLDILSSLSNQGAILLKLCDTFKPATSEKLEEALMKAKKSSNDNVKIAILAFARYSDTPISELAKSVVGELFRSSNSSVRAQALNVITYLEDAKLIEYVVKSGWSAQPLDPREQYFEVHYGSYVVVSAGKLGIISSDEVIARISPTFYGLAAQLLGNTAKVLISKKLSESLDKVVGADISSKSPPVEQNQNSLNAVRPTLLSLIDNSDGLFSIESMKRSSESPEEFDERQERSWESFKRFEKELSAKGARLIIDNVGLSAVKAFTEFSTETAVSYAHSFLSLPENKKIRVTNIALMLAQCLSSIETPLARKLFDHFENEPAVLTITHGLAAIPLGSLSIWESADNEAMDALRAKRLDRAANDHELSIEVLAALFSGKSDFLIRYAENLLDRERPIDKARALLILGFGDVSAKADSILARYSDSKGLIGAAFSTAKYAYERNVWSRHWYKIMCETESPEEFWRCGILLTKIVDGRFEIWANSFDKKGGPVISFSSCFESKLKNRIKRWKGKREKTLLGSKVPGDVEVN
ncbi:hypothetical protein [Aliikangiella maris]|uniref:NACHT domain-containing protein n=2 Tax=Aliikangiella maris TaxID=3162458 RepID=A0ABV3MLH6_9GAMM